MKTIKVINRCLLLCLCLGVISCGGKKGNNMETFEKGTFGYDLNYLAKKDSVILLRANDGKAQVVVSPKYQAKVFTSTTDGNTGKSLGYLNYKALEAENFDEHMNGYGGENRLWLGPEGGKYSIYFKPGTEQVYDNWHTPKPFDIEAWNVVSASDKSVSMSKDMEVANYLGNLFQVRIDRNISIVEPSEIASLLGIELSPSIKTVGYLTDNVLINNGNTEWTEETGTICIWMLDMFNTAPNSLTIIPFNEGSEDQLGTIATTNYFGEIPADRLKIENGLLYLKTDGKCRNKLGLNSLRAKSVAGNYDPDSRRLTITTFEVDPQGTYLNQEWNPNKNPLVGDAVNAYNDGPLEDGSIMGPFLEVESASPAAFLKPGASLGHKHNVFHFVGSDDELSLITEKLFGVKIAEIKNVFN